MTFSMTESSEKSRMFWKVRAMPALVIWLAFLPWIGRPWKRIEPSVGT